MGTAPHTTTAVRIYGPNLPTAAMQRKGTFHVHRAGCADCAKLDKNPSIDPSMDTEVTSCRAAAEFVYSDHIAEGSTTSDEALADFYFAPCLKGLPTDDPTHESQEDTMASTKTDAPKPPARRRRQPAAAPATDEQTTSKGLQEYRSRRAAAAANRTQSEAEAVAERATAVKAEQDAAPAKPKRGPSAEQIAARDAKKTAEAERVAKVIELRKAGKKLGEIAAELGYSSQQVVSGVIRRHAPELQTQREAGTGGLTLTPEQVTELQAVEAKFNAKLTTLARALARATA